MSFPRLSVVFLLVLGGADAAPAMTVDVNATTGGFVVRVDGARWFASNGSVFFRHRGARLSTDDGTLALAEVSVSNGTDNLGDFIEHSLVWQPTTGHRADAAEDPHPAADDGELDKDKVQFQGNIRAYARCAFFEQFWISGGVGTSAGDADALVSGFPIFQVPRERVGGSIAWEPV